MSLLCICVILEHTIFKHHLTAIYNKFDNINNNDYIDRTDPYILEKKS